ncbi:DBH-like monooxygenase protein 1 [Folsomia candida]|uniref:DBH-like monooxygenase protein 1 n=1 Tax=Folsomia candida TaxID=158441 RepID=A0A226EFG7_FOLCA|nr:DBH-like monooxygenase protein 1 [Folsomia candida]
MNLLIKIFCLAAILNLSETFQIYADVEKYNVKWEIDGDLITFSIEAETTGFVGLGFSRGGGMSGADIVVGGVRNGVPYLEDRHAISRSTPILDEEQNVELIEAFENDTHTFIKFSRKLETCDEEGDVAITEDTISLIWSFGATDDLVYHGANRGSRSVNLLDPQGPENPDLSKYKVWELRTVKAMPAADTTYWCTIHKSPNVPRKQHIVGFSAILESPSAYVHTHHMEAYLCHVPPGMESVFETYLNHTGEDCYYPDDPDFPGHFCESIAYGWAIGGEVVLFPDHVGFPLVSGEYFKLEVHYNNPNHLNDVAFDTGLKLYYTEDLRVLDAGRIAIGSEINFTQMIPPNSEKFVTVAHCDVSCTAELPENGVALFNFLIHAHLSGKKLKVRQFRNGEELPWLINDEHYDFNFQATRPFRKEMRLMPGDHLALAGGRTGPPLNHPSDTDPIVELPLEMQGRTFSQVVESVNWTPEVREFYQKVTRFDRHDAYCRPSGVQVKVGYPPHGEDYVPGDVCERRRR